MSMPHSGLRFGMYVPVLTVGFNAGTPPALHQILGVTNDKVRAKRIPLTREK